MAPDQGLNAGERPEDLIAPESGVIDYGRIDADAAASIGAFSGPIRLQRGYPGPKGWGEAHITSNTHRMSLLRGFGFDDAKSFVALVCHEWTCIRPSEKGRVMLCLRRDGYEYVVVVQDKTSAAGNRFWSVITAIAGSYRTEPALYEKVTDE